MKRRIQVVSGTENITANKLPANKLPGIPPTDTVLTGSPTDEPRSVRYRLCFVELLYCIFVI